MNSRICTRKPSQILNFSIYCLWYLSIAQRTRATSVGPTGVRNEYLLQPVARQLDSNGSEPLDPAFLQNSTKAKDESSLTFVTHRDLKDGINICRFKPVCRVGDGTLLLPVWMKQHSDRIQNCGIAKVAYTLNVDEEASLAYIEEAEGKKAEVSLKHKFSRYDVIGNYAPRGETYLLAQDVTPPVLMIDIFRRAAAYENATSILCETQNKVACRSENTSDISIFNPMMIVDSRVSDTKDFMWPKSLLRLVRNSVGGMLEVVDLKEMYGWKVRSEASCFRSVVSTNAKIVDMSPKSLTQSNYFFAKNSLSRELLGSVKETKSPCNIKVLILNRYGKRHIEGADVLRSAVQFLGGELHNHDKNVLVESEVVFFENSSFHEQVSVMQESNIVVASHGDSNSNFMFLRPKARVFEIMPFGFHSEHYEKLALAYGMMYSLIHGQPDADVFLSCVKHFNIKDNDERRKFINLWSSAAQNFAAETVREKANLKSTFDTPDDDNPRRGALQMLKECAGFQRISIDVRHLAQLVIEAAAEQCHVKGELAFLRKVMTARAAE